MSNWTRRGNSVQLQVYLGKDEDGKAIRRTKTVPYVSDQQAELDWLNFAVSVGSTPQPDLSVSELVRRVYVEVLKPRCKRQTLKGYRAAIKKIDETIGSVSLGKLDPYTVQHWVNALDLAPKTVKNYMSFLRRCIHVAIVWGLTDADPTRYVVLPSSDRKSVPVLSRKDLIHFIAELETLPASARYYKAAVYLALCCGLRRGETCALLCSDYNSETGAISVSKARYIDQEEVYTDTPKSHAAIRTVYAPQSIHPLLAELALEGGYLIKGAAGGAMYPDNLWHWLRRFEVSHSLPLVSYHSLRHTYAAILCEKSFSPAMISRSLGHAKISTTLDLYAYDIAPDSACIEAARSVDYIITTALKSPESLQFGAIHGGEGGIRTHADTE